MIVVVRILVAIILVVSAYGADAQSLPPGMTMHRLQAGELDSSGWTTASSTEGGLCVRLPMKFNDFSMAARDGSAAKAFTVGGKDPQGVKFSATRISYHRSGAAAKIVADLENGEGFASRARSLERLSFRGYRTVYLSVSDGRSVLYQRAILVEPDLVTLIVEAPA